uniref:hypothetical protein n=1 Tax=Dialister hominis TaxID=2582419 RepID=UPI003FF04339
NADSLDVHNEILLIKCREMGQIWQTKNRPSYERRCLAVLPLCFSLPSPAKTLRVRRTMPINTLLLYRAVPAGFMIQPSRLKVHLQKSFPVCFSHSAALFAIPDFLLFFSLPI